MIKVIDSFKVTPYEFLSNMYCCNVKIGNLTFKSAESAFQAAKCITLEERKQFVNLNGYEAKKLGKTVNLRKDWNAIRIDIMREIVTAKFMQNPTLMKRLKDTGIIELIEDNTWGDKFWGVCNGIGENHLGKILMQLRAHMLI